MIWSDILLIDFLFSMVDSDEYKRRDTNEKKKFYSTYLRLNKHAKMKYQLNKDVRLSIRFIRA